MPSWMLHGQPRQLSMSGLLQIESQLCDSNHRKHTQNTVSKNQSPMPPMLGTTHKSGDRERLDTAEGPTPVTIARNRAGASLHSCSIRERVICLCKQQGKSLCPSHLAAQPCPFISIDCLIKMLEGLYLDWVGST